jgi:hypothetical protein
MTSGARPVAGGLGRVERIQMMDLGFACVSRLWTRGFWARDCWAVACLQNLTILESSMNCTGPLLGTSMN